MNSTYINPEKVKMLSLIKQVTLLSVALSIWLVQGCSSIPNELIEQFRQHSTEFSLGPEDVLEVTVWRNQDLSRVVVVRPDGMISLPLIGDVHAGGLTAALLADKIAKRLTEFKENPSVSVSVKEVNSYYIYVLGEVLKPGKYPLRSYSTVLQSLSIGGGFTAFASRGQIHVVRSIKDEVNGVREIRISVLYSDLISGKGPIGNFYLRAGDTVVVP